MSEAVIITVPIYKIELSPLEVQSLKRLYQVMDRYRIIVVKPESLNLDELKKDFPELKAISFDDRFFRGVSGYNQLMLNSSFYKVFLDMGAEYMLVYQLDAYIFSDNLEYFISKGYDYVGAPWLKRKLYRVFPFLEYLKTSKKKYKGEGITWVRNEDNLIGNGGFSLRRLDSFYKACLTYVDRIAVYNSNSGVSSVYNEDVFWAKEPSEFKYPTIEEALRFSFDKYPRLCFKENGKELPMGCHGWYKWKWRSFWEKHIDFNIED